MANVFSLDGKVKRTMELPKVFSERVRPELVRRAVTAENSYLLQPQGHDPLAGMRTSARYYGAMGTYRTGRHMGIAIRPREKLGGGVQGKVKRIPSTTKGRRAHPHKVEKILFERMNKREYRIALACAVSATALGGSNSQKPSMQRPIIIADDIESLRKTKEVMGVIRNLGLLEGTDYGRDPRARKGVRRSTRIKVYGKKVLLIVGKESSVMQAARNIPGVDVCEVSKITANLLAPGGVPGRITVWSESAVSNVTKAIDNMKVLQ
jgi:large subunit ribosomal protein L4e